MEEQAIQQLLVSNSPIMIIIAITLIFLPKIKAFINDIRMPTQDKELHKSVKRLEYLIMTYTDRPNKDTICKIYDDYKALGGNSYIDILHNKYMKEMEARLDI